MTVTEALKGRTRVTYDRVETRLVREQAAQPYRVTFRGSSDAYQFCRDLQDADREKFLTILLDQKNKIIALDIVSMGSATTAIVHPREVFKTALVCNAVGLILVHNHPSGDPTPSKEDIALTTRLREGADLLGLKILDHIIIGTGRYVSFVDDGYW